MKRPRCPKCGSKTHRCKTGCAGCRHCDNEMCGFGWVDKTAWTKPESLAFPPLTRSKP